MRAEVIRAVTLVAVLVLHVSGDVASAQTFFVGPMETVVSTTQRETAGLPYWPDTPMGVLKSGSK